LIVRGRTRPEDPVRPVNTQFAHHLYIVTKKGHSQTPELWFGKKSTLDLCCEGKIIESKDEKKIFRYGELNPGLAGLMLYMRAADASHYTITDIDIS
jgi:hypothetical protein